MPVSSSSFQIFFNLLFFSMDFFEGHSVEEQIVLWYSK